MGSHAGSSREGTVPSVHHSVAPRLPAATQCRPPSWLPQAALLWVVREVCVIRDGRAWDCWEEEATRGIPECPSQGHRVQFGTHTAVTGGCAEAGQGWAETGSLGFLACWSNEQHEGFRLPAAPPAFSPTGFALALHLSSQGTGQVCSGQGATSLGIPWLEESRGRRGVLRQPDSEDSPRGFHRQSPYRLCREGDVASKRSRGRHLESQLPRRRMQEDTLRRLFQNQQPRPDC